MMLKRRTDDHDLNSELEDRYRAIAPAGLRPERRDAIRDRVFTRLQSQSAGGEGRASQQFGRWLLVPVIVASAAIGAIGFHWASELRTSHQPASAANGALQGGARPEATPGQTVAASQGAQLVVGDSFQIEVEPGSRVTLDESAARVLVRLARGEVVVASKREVRIRGVQWTVTSTTADSAARVSEFDQSATITIQRGIWTLKTPDINRTLTPDDQPFTVPDPPVRQAAQLPPQP